MTFNYDEWAGTMEDRYGKDWKKVMAERGAIGGKARVSKGFGGMSPEKRAEASRKGVEARRAKNA